MRIERLGDRYIVYLTDLELETLRAGACSVVDLHHRIGVTRDANVSLSGDEQSIIASFPQPYDRGPGREIHGVRLESGDSTGEPAGPIWGCDPDND